MTSESLAEHRLPYDVRPRHYEIHLVPDLETFRFLGEVEIALQVMRTTDRIVLNTAELDFDEVVLHRSEGESEPLRIELDEHNERASFVARSVLDPGEYRLVCRYRGIHNDKMLGFYRSTYTGADGTAKVMAVTHFQSADARRCFPCFDEPDRKASFAVTVDVPAGMTAVSNAPERSSEPLADGRRRIGFAPTPVMSTYLVAIVVGELEMSEAAEFEGAPVRIVTVAGKSHLHAAALDAALHALRYYRDYFELPYLGEKLDLVAVPDFAFGAMENVGCVTFREVNLLADPENTSRPELERIVEVVNHELAHLWFGDLVTMRWWNGLWLNESFATFMALCCSDDYRPEWNSFDSYARERALAYAIDALHSTRAIEFPARTPADAEAMVDALTYEKGASVLWMVETFVGKDRFRAGIRRYLAEHQFANAETTELWDAIGREVPEVAMRALMDSWIFQGGAPVVRAARDETSGAVTLAQEPFTYLEHPPAGTTSAVGDRWLIPMTLASGKELSRREQLLLEGATVLERDTPVLVNAGGTGYFRVDYDDGLFSALCAHVAELEPLDRYGLAADTWALCLARRRPLERFIELLGALRSDREPNVLSVLAGALTTLDLLAADSDRSELRRFARELFAPVLADIGEQRRSSEPVDDALVRARAIAVLGTIAEDPAVVSAATAAVRADLAGGRSLDPDLASVQLAIFAAHGDATDRDALLDRLAHPRNPNDETRVRLSLASLRSPELAAPVLERCLFEIRGQDAPGLLASMLQSRQLAFTTYAFVRDHYDELRQRLGEYGFRRIFSGLPGLAALDPAGGEVDVDAVRAFCAPRVSESQARHLAQALERLETNVLFARTIRHRLAALLSD